MKIAINHIDIPNNKSNEVTSHKVFVNKRIKNSDGSLAFHQDGPFSERIFGKFSKCTCGELTKPGICPSCGCRVLNPKKIPDFYISFKDIIRIPYKDIDFSDYSKDKKLIDNLLHYRGFLYEGIYHVFDLNKIKLTDFDESKVLIGKEAILSLGVSEDWYNSQTTDKIYIPHPSFRKITKTNDKYFLGPLNTAIINLLKYKSNLVKFLEYAEDSKFSLLTIQKTLITEVDNIYNELFNLLAKHKKSIISREVKGQNLTGAIRGVITNNFSLDEDIVILGSYFIPTLYPELYAKYTTYELDNKGNDIPGTEKTNIEALNKELLDKSYYVLINRPPTIGEKSIMAFRPVFSLLPSEKYVVQLNPISMDGFSGDYDGDVLLVPALYTTAANTEAEQLLPSNNYIGGANYQIRNGLPEDFVYVFQKIYEQDPEAAKEISQLINKDLYTSPDFVSDYTKLQELDRQEYIEVYHDLGDRMFKDCEIPTVADFVNVAGKKNSETEKSRKKIEHICSFNGNTDDIMTSIKKRDAIYTNDESDSFMQKVIASNISDISNSGFFYKKLISSCDNMKISMKHPDCESEGQLFNVSDIDESTFNFKIKTHWIMEFDSFVESYDEFIKLVDEHKVETIHVRNFLTCKDSLNHRKFCRKCAGVFRRSKVAKFVPENIGIYSTLMITEHATQASLDSMNKGRSVSVNEALEEKLDPKGYPNYEAVKEKIEEIIDLIGDVGVMSKYYEIALLSRFYRNSDDSYTPSPLISSFNKQGDKLGRFIYQSTESNFNKLLSSNELTANSLKSRIMFDIYD